jgi:lipopolysaccharide biosynthesis glycosyltransferase
LTHSLWIGFDPREASAFAVARESAKRLAPRTLPINGVILNDLKNEGIYWRPTEVKRGVESDVLWDVISDAPMSTEFAISRFFVPFLAQKGWAMFTDCDVLFRGNVVHLMRTLDPQYAVYCVKHNHVSRVLSKMDGQQQTQYARKNWSSVMIFNCDHPSNKKLNAQLLNTVPGRDLHRFCWLEDHEIGELDPEWNWLVGEQPQPDNPKIVHYTLGGPWFANYRDVPLADEWNEVLLQWAR